MAEVGSHWSYDLLKQLTTQKCSNADINDLKDIFSNVISRRKYDLINNVDDLIRHLESCDILNESDVLPLRTVADQCNNSRLQDAIDNYKPIEVSEKHVNQYQEQRLAEKMRLKSTAAPVHRQQHYVTTAELSERKRESIFKKLSQDLGKSWRSFGRSLSIGEGQLDEIEVRFPHDLKSRIIRVLQLFEEDECHDPRHMLLLLCRALADCGRQDLRRNVEQIMSH